MVWLFAVVVVAAMCAMIHAGSRRKRERGIVLDFSSLPMGVKAQIADHMIGRTGMAFALANKECSSMINPDDLKKTFILELLFELVDNVPEGFEGHFEMFYRDIDSVFVMFHKGYVELQSTSSAPDEYFKNICKELGLKHEWKDATDMDFESLHISYSNQEERFAVYRVVQDALNALQLRMGDKWMELTIEPIIGHSHDVNPLQKSRYSKLIQLI